MHSSVGGHPLPSVRRDLAHCGGRAAYVSSRRWRLLHSATSAAGGVPIEPGILLGVGSAAAWGTGDFAGGLAARRAGGMLVTGGAQLVGFGVLLVAVLVLRPAPPPGSTLLLGALGGIAGGLGLAALYRGLGMGAMGLVSAVSGVGAALLPLAVGALLWGTLVQPLQLAGVACALVAIALASGATMRGVSRDAVLLGLVAAIGFGLWFIFLDRA